jgi:GGDEF domain-containing protein
MSLTLAVTLGLLSLAETGYSILLLDPGFSSAAVQWLPDACNLMALVGICVYFYLEGGLDLVPKKALVRVGLDAASVLVLTYVGLYRFWIRGLQQVGSAGWDPARWTFYALIGIVVLAGNAMMFSSRASGLWRRWEMLAAAGTAVYSVGVVLWPVWYVSTRRGDDLPAVVVFGMIYLAGYFMLGMSGLARLDDPETTWRRNLEGQSAGVNLFSQVLATGAIVGVPLIGMAVLTAEPGSEDQLLYLAAVSLATAAVVARNLIAAREAEVARRHAVTDPVTGAYNLDALEVRCGELIGRSRMTGSSFALYALRLDLPLHEAGTTGSAEIDAALTRVAVALTRVSDKSESVFRIEDRGFAVIVADVDAGGALNEGHRLLGFIRELGDGAGVSGAAAGVAVWPDHAGEYDELLSCAVSACTWATLQGGDRVVVFSDHITRVVDIDSGHREEDGETRMALVRALAAASDSIDSSRHAHAHNVAALSLLLGDALGLDDPTLRRLQLAAMLHDVGKIALPSAILGKRALNIRERREVESHSGLGERLVSSLGYEGIPGWVRSHHERWDGQGYPDGLCAEEIPREARIIALADAYDVMTRSKGGWGYSKAAALQEIDHGMGSKFDPELAETFIAVVAETVALGWGDGSAV